MNKFLRSLQKIQSVILENKGLVSVVVFTSLLLISLSFVKVGSQTSKTEAVLGKSFTPTPTPIQSGPTQKPTSTPTVTPAVIVRRIVLPTTTVTSIPTPTTSLSTTTTSNNSQTSTPTPTQVPAATTTPTPIQSGPTQAPVTSTPTPTFSPSPTPTPVAVGNNVEIKIEYAGQRNPDSYNINIDAGQSAWEAVKKAVGSQNVQYTDYGGDLGIFITGFNGVSAAGNQYYEFRVNGASSNVGVSSYICNNADLLEFVLTTF